MRSDWVLIALIFVIGIFAAGQFIKVSLSLPQLSAFYGYGIAEVSVLVSLVGIVSIVFGLVAGNIVAAFGARKTLCAALLLGSSISILQVFLPPIWVMLILRFIEGFSHLAVVVSAPAMMAGAASERSRPIAMALWATFFGVSFALATIIVPKLLDIGGLPILFGVHGIGFLVLAALVALRAPYSNYSPLELRYLRTHLTTYSTPNLCAPALGFVFYTFIYVALLTFLPEAIDKPNWQTWLPLIALIATMLAGWLLRFWGTFRTSLFGFSLTVVGGLGVLQGIDFAVWFMFIGLGFIPAAQFAMIAELNGTEGKRAKAAGAIAQMGNVGTATGTPVFAVLLLWGGTSWIFLSIIAASCLGYVTVWLYSRQITPIT